MYLRHTTRRRDGKTHIYWQLVRSVRCGRKVVQQTVAQLGELDAEGRARAQALARSIASDAVGGSQHHLFDDAPAEAVPVKLGKVRVERSRSFGAVWLGWLLWRALKLDELCEGLLPRGREVVGALDGFAAGRYAHRVRAGCGQAVWAACAVTVRFRPPVELAPHRTASWVINRHRPLAPPRCKLASY